MADAASALLVPARQHDMSEEYMNTDNNEMRAEYRRDDLGKGIRGKYAARYAEGTNLVLLDDKVAKAFPTAAAVNSALLALLALTEQTAQITKHATTHSPKRRAA
jgi:uncharacterized protein YcsI (UPF0317 family)